jgi:hypothetical protein
MATLNIFIYRHPSDGNAWVSPDPGPVERTVITKLKFHFMEKEGQADVNLTGVPIDSGEGLEFLVYPHQPVSRDITDPEEGVYRYKVEVDGTAAYGRPPGSDPVIIIHPPNE